MIVRVTGVSIKNNEILLLDQDTSNSRSWSLPGGKVESHETLETALVREMKEETGLDVSVKELLYVCDLITPDTHVLHITFRVDIIGGNLGENDKSTDTREIRQVKYVPVGDLHKYGFSRRFQELVEANFPKAGSYMGSKDNIGL